MFDTPVLDRLLPGALGRYVYPADAVLHMTDRESTSVQDVQSLMSAEECAMAAEEVEWQVRLNQLTVHADTQADDEDEEEEEEDSEEDDNGEEGEDHGEESEEVAVDAVEEEDEFEEGEICKIKYVTEDEHENGEGDRRKQNTRRR